MLSCVLATLLAQAPVATTPGAPPASATTAMTGTLALGASILTGNSQTTTFTFGSALTWKTPDWIYGFKASGAYGRSTDASTGVEARTVMSERWLFRTRLRISKMPRRAEPRSLSSWAVEKSGT